MSRAREQTLTEHGAPSLVDDVQAHGAGHLVHVRVEHAVLEADGGGLERVLLRQRHMYLPGSSLVRSCAIVFFVVASFFLTFFFFAYKIPQQTRTQRTR